MSTAGGPRLEGIGRGGDSNDIVLCMDTHDAGSYPGEPTSNIVPNPNFVNGTTTTWSTYGTGATLTAVADSNNPVNSPYILKLVRGSANASVYTELINKTFQGASYTMSCWAKGDGTMSFGKYDNNSGWGSGGELAVTLTDEWQLITLYTSINGSDTTNSIKFYICADLAGDYVYLAGPQFELKTYATPYVWDGYNGRPATTNLMIHGNVGTGTSFEDSSPSKHAIVTSGNTTHSNGSSEFPGGSIYFDASSDYLTLGDSSDWDFGQGDFTIDFWLGDPVDTGIWAEVFSQGWTSGDDSWLIGIDWGSTNKLQFGYTTDGSTDKNTGYTTSQVPTSGWTHYAIVRSSFSGQGSGFTSAIKVYVNGTEEVSYTSGADTIHSSSKPLTIGQRATSIGTFNYNGYMDEVRITKGTALWRGNFTPPTRRSLSAPAVDLSGNYNGGNFATTDMTDVATFRDGQVIEPVASAVWDFDGTDDVIDLGNINYNGLPGLTVATWVYSSNFAANDSFMSSWGDNVYSNYAWLLFVSQWTSRKVEWLISSNGTGYNRCAGATALTDNRWYHVAATWTTSAMKLYLNGVEDGSQTSPSSIMNNNFNTFIGCDSDGSSEAKVRFFGGQMGNSAIWKTALTAAQVRQNFNTQRSRFKV